MIDPADPRQLETLLKRHRIDLSHRLGQNFLVDQRLRDEVAVASGVTNQDDVLEVGAGAGTLTVALAPLCRRVVAVELDERLIPILRDVTREHGNVEIVRADILRFDTAKAFPDGGEVVAGNIPYNLTGALIRRLLDRPPRPRRLSLVVQKEVAERWAASTGASLASVAVQVYARAKVLMSLPAEAFMPPPRVDSSLVILEVRPAPAVEVDDVDRFLRFVESVFQHRRKQLGGALGRVRAIGSTEAGQRLRTIGIDPRRRAQTLELSEWEAVYRAFNLSLGR